MTLDEVNTTIYQPKRSDYHRGRIGRGDNQISGVDKSWYLTEIQSHQLFYYKSKSEVSDILGVFFHCNSHHNYFFCIMTNSTGDEKRTEDFYLDLVQSQFLVESELLNNLNFVVIF